jgi:hypothetical protein
LASLVWSFAFGHLLSTAAVLDSGCADLWIATEVTQVHRRARILRRYFMQASTFKPPVGPSFHLRAPNTRPVLILQVLILLTQALVLRSSSSSSSLGPRPRPQVLVLVLAQKKGTRQRSQN